MNEQIIINEKEVIIKRYSIRPTGEAGAKTSEEIKQLLEVGFEYVVEKDNLMFFRKRK
jgi:hypothetical protein